MRTLAVLLLLAPAASAQPQAPRGPSGPPGFSPYLNLARPGTSAGVNYYGLVRPEQQFRQQLGQLQQQVQQFGAGNPAQRVEDDIAPAGDQITPATGHPTTFNNTGGYFNRLTGIGAPGAAGTAPRLPQGPARTPSRR